MTKITQIEDKSAAIAWSPCIGEPDIIALGTKDSGGIGFDDTGGELDLYDLNLNSPEGHSPQPKLVGSVKTKSRFASVSWTVAESISDRFRMGLLAGGMTDGTVHLWNPTALMQQQDPSVTSISKSGLTGPVKALKFSHLNPTQLAAGGANGQVMIADVSNPESPDVFTPAPEHNQNAEITAVAWNTQVAHIVASAAGDGTVAVWDLNSRKAWCELRCETSGQAVADIIWNPTQGLHLLTASADDRNPVLKLWDLRATTSMPLATLTGHTGGILKTSWCPHDDSLLLSCGKDNRTILWDLLALRPIADVPTDIIERAEDFNSSQNGGFGASGLNSAQQRRYDIQWSPMKRGVLATCSLDRKVQVHSVIGLATKCGRPPKWMKPSSSVACGYGGSVVSCGNSDKIVRMRTEVEEPELVKASTDFEAQLESTNVAEFCMKRVAIATSAQEQQAWGFMKVIFASNARQELVNHLGFDAESVAQAAREYTDAAPNGGAAPSPPPDKVAGMSKAAEEAVKKALLVGNFVAGVECCFRTGNYADALMLASCGGPELWAKTQQRYFESETPKRPFLAIISAVMRSQLGELVEASDPTKWQETLALLSTYAQSEEFPKLCITLGDRLSSAGDNHSANLCYLCSLSLEHSVKHWTNQLEAAEKRRGSTDLLALHEFVVKVAVFMKAAGTKQDISAAIADLFSKYAGSLADQGLLVTAAKYCRGDSEQSKILRDRLYRSRASQHCLQVLRTPPPFPFSLTAPKKSQPSVKVASTQNNNTAARTTNNNANQQNAQQQSRQTQNAATNAPVAAAPVPAAAPQLPAGWVALQDPSSGKAYYANQTTGATSWELPAGTTHATHQQPSTMAPAAQAQPTQTQYKAELKPAASASGTTSSLASRYGDGFVSSASHPELAYQYGNVGTSNPYTGVTRPGIAKIGASKAPVSATLNFDNIELPAEFLPIKDGLLNITASLAACPLSATDKRQLAEAEKGVAILVKRLALGDIETNVSGKVLALVTALLNRDYNTTTTLQKNLVNDDWKDHKDWLKGIKFLIQLASKKI